MCDGLGRECKRKAICFQFRICEPGDKENKLLAICKADETHWRAGLGEGLDKRE